MKNILLFLFLLLMAQTCFGQSNKFFDTILEYERCRDCYFLSIDVASEKYSGNVVIENDDLFGFLNKTRGLDKTQYKEFAKDLLVNKKKLVLDKSNVESDGTFLKIKGVSEHEFRVVNEIPDIEAVSAQGCVAFVKHYFPAESIEAAVAPVSEDCREFIRRQNDDLLMKSGLSTMERSVVINKLFEWEIPTRMDDYSGSLTIRKVDFRKHVK
ncbi:MAG: hypothetical protein WBD22_00010 [Pyrinomonadaceae bacterium]